MQAGCGGYGDYVEVPVADHPCCRSAEVKVVIGDCLRRQRQTSQAQYPATGSDPDGAHGCNLGGSSPPCSIVRERRPTTLVQLELIRTAAIRAANAVGLLCGPHPCRLLPSRQIRTDRCGQIWNIDPAHDRRRTVLDDVPTPTEEGYEHTGGSMGGLPEPAVGVFTTAGTGQGRLGQDKARSRRRGDLGDGNRTSG
jgi:hypothetical protein